MKQIYLFFLLLVMVQVQAQDTIIWKLDTNDTALVTKSSGMHFLISPANQVRGAGMPVPNYSNNYQEISMPAAGWPQTVNPSTTNSFLEFPFKLHADHCWDTVGTRVCSGYAYFFIEHLKFSGYVNNIADSVTYEVYFSDTSEYSMSSNNGNQFKYLGDATIRSVDPLLPTIITIPTTNQTGVSIYKVGDGAYSSFRLYPKRGGNLHLKNVIVAGATAVALPISFIKFSGTRTGSTIHLSWQIENAAEVVEFVIERSANGRNYEFAGIVKGSANTTFSWSGKEGTPGGFYRVRAVKRDGSFLFSNVLKLPVHSKPGFVAYPNPVKSNQVNLQVSNIVGTFEIVVYDLQGRKVYAEKIGSSAISFAVVVQLPTSLAKGNYKIVLQSNDQVYHQQVLLQ